MENQAHTCIVQARDVSQRPGWHRLPSAAFLFGANDSSLLGLDPLQAPGFKPLLKQRGPAVRSNWEMFPATVLTALICVDFHSSIFQPCTKVKVGLDDLQSSLPPSFPLTCLIQTIPAAS